MEGDATMWTSMGYNGELHEVGGSVQLLGNGYRSYSAILMRFHSPDSMSPFGEGGINPYTYCKGDPANHIDPSGHFLLPMAALFGAGAVASFGASAVTGLLGERKSAEFLALLGGVLSAVAILAGGIHGFTVRHSRLRMGEVRIHRGRRKNILDVHGRSDGSLVGNQPMDGTEMTALLRSEGLDDKPLVYLSCNSGSGPASQAQVVANGIEQPVIGFLGPVRVNKFTNRPMGAYRAIVFHPQAGLARAATAIRNTALHRRSHWRSAQRQPRSAER